VRFGLLLWCTAFWFCCAVYHVTDLPAFVSGSQLVFFDPQVRCVLCSDSIPFRGYYRRETDSRAFGVTLLHALGMSFA
jgi:hypothetical protein